MIKVTVQKHGLQEIIPVGCVLPTCWPGVVQSREVWCCPGAGVLSGGGVVLCEEWWCYPGGGAVQGGGAVHGWGCCLGGVVLCEEWWCYPGGGAVQGGGAVWRGGGAVQEEGC